MLNYDQLFLIITFSTIIYKNYRHENYKIHHQYHNLIHYSKIHMLAKYSEKYQEMQQLGRGSFGVAYLVRSKNTGTLLVAKKVFLKNMTDEERKNSAKQVQILKQLNSPFIVRYFESFVENKQLIIIMEYCQEGELSNLIHTHKQKKQMINEDVIANWFVQLCMGLQHIHQNKIIHRDIKTSNIFLNSNKTIKIGDFGISKVLETINQSAHTFVGTPYYLSPQVCSDKPYGYKSDIWALGCVLYQLCTLKFVFEANSLPGILMKIVKQKVPRIPKNYSQQLSEIVLKILSKEVGDRPTIDQIFNSDYIKKSMIQFLNRGGEADVNVPVKKTILHETIQSNIKNTTMGSNTIRSEYLATQKQEGRKLNPKQQAQRRKQLKNAEQFQVLSKAARQSYQAKFGNNTVKQRVINMSEINKTLASKTYKQRSQKARRLMQQEEYERNSSTYTKRHDPNDERQLPVTMKLSSKKEEQKKPTKPSYEQQNDDDLEQYNDQDFEQYHEQEDIRITQAATKQDLQKVQEMYDKQLNKAISPLVKNQSEYKPNQSFLLNAIQLRIEKLIEQMGKIDYKKVHDYIQKNQDKIDDDDFESDLMKKFPKVNRDQLNILMQIIYRQSLQKTTY